MRRPFSSVRLLRKTILAATAVLGIASCARMGNPDGGWFDDTPPRVVASSPKDGGVDVAQKKISISFNEYIKLEDAQQKVIISPPQIEQADIRAAGKRILINLQDSLKPNTTYTIDFSDAISDNNEGNPMGNYTFSFSTGKQIDTLQVAGYCLNAEDLEPIKGILVGLYPADSLKAPDLRRHEAGEGTDSTAIDGFHRMPMTRVARTNGSGRFVIKGVAPGNYLIRALEDADGDFVYGQKSERIGFVNDTLSPSAFLDTRQDTIWRDSLRIDSIATVAYTHFTPDVVTLLCFQEPQTDRYLLKTERKDPERIDIFFTYGSDSLPRLRGLDFNADSAFVVEASQKRDTVSLWLRDSLLINQDTLTLEITSWQTDTLGSLSLKTDTVEALPKVSYEKRKKAADKETEKWQKDQEKKQKKGLPFDSIMPVKPLVPKIALPTLIDPMQTVTMEMPVPLERLDTQAVHLYTMVDSVWYNARHVFRQVSTRSYQLLAAWRMGGEYSLEIDSAAFVSIYGLASKKFKQGFKVRTEDDYSSLQIDLSGLPDDAKGVPVLVQLLDPSEKVVRQERADSALTAMFFYLKPGSYYVRAIADANGNGEWDTGIYDDDRQAEAVFYYPEIVECKEKWDVSRTWNVSARQRHLQKPAEITKQKPDQEKQLKNRNLDRAREKGKDYVPR